MARRKKALYAIREQHTIYDITKSKKSLLGKSEFIYNTVLDRLWGQIEPAAWRCAASWCKGPSQKSCRNVCFTEVKLCKTNKDLENYHVFVISSLCIHIYIWISTVASISRSLYTYIYICEFWRAFLFVLFIPMYIYIPTYIYIPRCSSMFFPPQFVIS